MNSECPYHARPKHRECHHIGEDYVTVYWHDDMRRWLVKYGHLSHRGSITTLAVPEEVEYMLSKLREWAA